MSHLTYAGLWLLYWRCLRRGHMKLAATIHARLHTLAAQ